MLGFIIVVIAILLWGPAELVNKVFELKDLGLAILIVIALYCLAWSND